MERWWGDGEGSFQSGHAHAQWSRLALYFQWRYITVGSEGVLARTATLLPACLFRLKKKGGRKIINSLSIYFISCRTSCASSLGPANFVKVCVCVSTVSPNNLDTIIRNNSIRLELKSGRKILNITTSHQPCQTCCHTHHRLTQPREGHITCSPPFCPTLHLTSCRLPAASSSRAPSDRALTHLSAPLT